MLRNLLLAAGATLGFSVAQASPSPIGNWLTADNTAVVQISPCGAQLCGRFAGIVVTQPGAPMPKNWLGQPMCGEVFIHVSQDLQNGDAWTGTVQKPTNGKLYKARITRDGPNLHLRGYFLLPAFGQTQTWRAFTGTVPADCRMMPG